MREESIYTQNYMYSVIKTMFDRNGQTVRFKAGAIDLYSGSISSGTFTAGTYYFDYILIKN